MPKLFIAVDLPVATTVELARLQPGPQSGVRLVEPTQMHLTLHFIGEGDEAALAIELQKVSVASFAIDFEGVGQFPSAGGTVTLWAGARKSADLLRLHSAVADALVRQGYEAETRPYSPHVTLARCAPAAPSSVVTEFLTRNATISLPAVPVARFGLFSSVTVDDAPFYRCERWFPLLTLDRDWAVHRQDDNGNRFVVQTGLSHEEAERLAAELEARGHKQLYWVER